MKKMWLIAMMACFLALGLALPEACARIKVFAEPDRPVVEADSEDSTAVVKVGLYADDMPPAKRLPLNLAVVLDKSGSMGSYDKIENAKRGAMDIVSRLNQDDIFSLIVYDSQPRVLIPAQRVKDTDYLIGLIQDIEAGGSTALYGGVSFGGAQVRKNLSSRYINRIILLSDGLANVGPQTTEEVVRLGRSLSAEGITVSTIGLGLDYNEELMTGLARESDANHYFVENSDSLPEIFSQEIGQAMTLVARDIKINFECLGGVQPGAVIGRKGRVKGESMEAGIKDLYGTSQKYALFEIRLPRGSDGQVLKAARVSIEFQNPASGETVRKTQDVNLRYSSDQKYVRTNINKAVSKDIALTKAAVYKEEALKFSRQGDYRQAAEAFSQGQGVLEKSAQVCDNDRELITAAQENQQLSQDVIDNQGLTLLQYKETEASSFKSIIMQ